MISGFHCEVDEKQVLLGNLEELGS
jgi:hypothetical protein